MYDHAYSARCNLTDSGVHVRPVGTLVDRALDYLVPGPADSTALVHNVLGVPAATPPVAERLASALLSSHPRVRQRGKAVAEPLEVLFSAA